MLLRTLLTGAVTLLYAMATVVGCNNSNESTDTSTAASTDTSPPTTISSAPPATPEPTPTPPKPKWAAVFLQCLELIGKPKDSIVTAFGAPDGVFGLANRYDYNRKFKDDGFELFLYFAEGSNKLQQISLNLQDKPAASDVWEALGNAGSKPLYYQAHNESIKNYWRGRDGNSPSGDANMLIAVNGIVQGQEIQLNGRIAQPPLKAETKFDTKTDSYVVGELRPNPDSSWRDAKVNQVQSGKHETGFFGEIYGHEHFIDGEPEIKLRPPSPTLVETDIAGLWQGTMAGVKVDLLVQSRDKNTFRGTLTSYDPRGKIKVAIKGTLPGNNAVTMQHVKVLSVPHGVVWSLGVNTGTFGDNGQSMSGIGRASAFPLYGWTLAKKSS